MSEPRFGVGDQVVSTRFGTGRVEFDKGETVIVRFEHGLEECERIARPSLAEVPPTVSLDGGDRIHVGCSSLRLDARKDEAPERCPAVRVTQAGRRVGGEQNFYIFNFSIGSGEVQRGLSSGIGGVEWCAA